MVNDLERKQGYIEFFDNEAIERYDSTRNFYEFGYGGMRERKLLSLFCRGTKVLNAACGTGRLLHFLYEKGFQVVGIDLSRGMLKVAREKTRDCKNVVLIRCDAEFLPFREGFFDEIVCSRAFKLFPNPLDTLSEWSRVLRVGGKSVVSLETSDALWIKIGYWLKVPFMGSRFEWRYRVENFQFLFGQAGFHTVFQGCVIYSGRMVYEAMEKYFRPLLKLMELVDSHSKMGRNVMFVGIKK